ncbi:MAG: IspD/TarI family cytidylyltransferase [bacterium]
MKIALCIVAAGRGVRLGDEYHGTPKALIPLLGRAMLFYSMNSLDTVSSGTEFIVAVPQDSENKFRKLIGEWGFSHKVRLVYGGETRAGSVRNILAALKSDSPDMILIHDAARVCLTNEMVEQLLAASNHSNAATLAHAATDTLREFSDGFISGEIPRENIACIETPQIFPFKKLVELYEKTTENPTDETTLFTRTGEKVRVVFHEDDNMKITYAEDIAAAEGILFARGWIDGTDEE